MRKQKKHKNDTKEKALDWDIFLAPHHCSWSFFNNTPQEENKIPVTSSLEILDYGRSSCKIIASAKVIKNNADNPPHYQAKQEYIKKLESSADFLNTAVEPKEAAPEPIVFEVTSTGFSRVKSPSAAEKLAAATSIATSSLIRQPWAK